MSQNPSDLAPFVAAVIRDKVVMEQSETIAQMKAQLDTSRAIEVTGPKGNPIFAIGSFQDGKFHPDCWDLEWLVDLEMTQQQQGNDCEYFTREHGNGPSQYSSMHLRDLANIEIHLGGLLFATSKDVEGTAPIGLEGNSTQNHSVSFLFGVKGREAWLKFRLPELPRESWINLKSTALYNTEESRTIERRSIYEMLSNRMSSKLPHQIVEISSISFVAEGVKKMITSLKRTPEFEQEKIEQLQTRCR